MIESRVYFIQGEDGGPIKIGMTADIRQRIRTMQTGSPVGLTLLAHRPGDAVVEWQYHQKFAAHRISGEWFIPHADIQEEINRVRLEFGQAMPAPPKPERPAGHAETHERQRRFMSRTLAAALEGAYGGGPGWAKRAAQDANVTSRAIHNWRLGTGTLPQMESLVTMSRNNPTMFFWFCISSAACWLAEDVGTSEEEALSALLAFPTVVEEAWLSPTNDDHKAILAGALAKYRAQEARP